MIFVSQYLKSVGTFNPKISTMFAHAKVGLNEHLFAFYTLLRFNTSIGQLDSEFDVSYRSLRRRVKQFARTLDAPAISLVGAVEIDGFYVSARLKDRERDFQSRLCDLSKRGRGSYADDKPPVFTLADRGSDQRCTDPAKSADESTIRLFLDDREEESLTVFTDGFRAYDPLEDEEDFQREEEIHGDGGYVNGDARVNSGESHSRASDAWLSPHQGVSKDKFTSYLRVFQFRRRIFRKPGQEALKEVVRTVL